MKIILPGGSGQIGKLLARHFHARGDEVVVLGRNPQAPPEPWRTVVWDGAQAGDWADELEGADALINLAGRSVNCRYSAANRAAIMNSRLDSTRAVGAALAACAAPPPVWLQSSTATIYAHRFDAANDEAGGLVGGADAGAPDAWRFSTEVAKAWEAAAEEAALGGTRLVLMRSAMVMSPDRGGVFDTLLGLARRGLGGRAGDGRQFVSWIHETDFLRAIDLLLDRAELCGAVNIASPNPLPNEAFMRALRAAWGIRFGLPAPRPLLEIGALLMRTETELVLKSRRVVPARLLDAGMGFEFAEWAGAAEDLCERWRSRHGTE